MKLDLKIFTLFIITILIYGVGYYFGNLGKFIFPVNYSHFVIGIISLYFFFTTKFSQFSVFLLPFGLSLIYLILPKELEEYTVWFQATNAITIVLFLIFLFKYAVINKSNEFRIYFLLVVLSEMVGIGIRGMIDNVILYKIIYGINFILLSLILRKEKETERLDIGIKRMVITLGMYYFVEMMDFY